MFEFIKSVTFDIQKKSIERKMEVYKVLAESGVSESSDKMIDLQIEIAKDAMRFKHIWGEK